MVDVVDLKEKFNLVNEHWSPHVVGNVNNCAVKVAKLKGDFPWHSHAHEDEMFFVVQGDLTIRLRDRKLELSAGQFAIIPAGTEHQPSCDKEVWVMFVEPKTTVNTGELENSSFTKTDLPNI